MKLSGEQRRMLDGERGEMVARMMKLLVRLGEVYGADRMLAIASAQVSGVSYKSIGEPGLRLLLDIARAGVKVRVLTFLNPAGMDLEAWRKLGFPREFAAEQERIMRAFRRLGAVTSATCTPYLAGNLPRFGEHLAWAESSAVSFANSVIGARTNREGGPSALAAAICGCTPNYGLHCSENRRPTVVVRVEAPLRSRADFGALGYRVGELVKNGVPFFTGMAGARTDDLKALGAAMAASGAVALYHVEGVTPEAHLARTRGLDSFGVKRRDLGRIYERLNTRKNPVGRSRKRAAGRLRPDIIVTGCPHASLPEIIDLAQRLQGRKLRIPLWICTSRAAKKSAEQMGLCAVIEGAGGALVADTCMVVSPLERMGHEVTAVDSAKAAHYLPGFCSQQVVFGGLDELIEDALA
jgi:predicted aconitase